MIRKSPALIGLSAAFAVVTAAAAGDSKPDYAAVADNVVNHSLEIQPGESVIITGTPGQLPLLEELVVATWKAGGKPTVEMTMPKANKRAIMETPLQHLEIGSRLDVVKANAVDAYINVGAVDDPELFADVPEKRFAALRKANRPLTEAVKKADFRSVSLGQSGGIPTEAFAKQHHADYTTLTRNFWRSVAVSGDTLKRRAEALTAKMRPGGKLHLTTDHGTDLTVTLAEGKPGINTGRTADNVKKTGPSNAWLPAGECYSCLNPTSADGTVVIPSMRFRGTPVRNLRASFENGKLTELTADQGEDKVGAFFAELNEASRHLTAIDIGLNPESKPLSGSDYLSWEMDGVVTLALGQANWAGCDNDADGDFAMHVADANLTLDDSSELIAKGRLKVATK